MLARRFYFRCAEAQETPTTIEARTDVFCFVLLELIFACQYYVQVFSDDECGRPGREHVLLQCGQLIAFFESSCQTEAPSSGVGR